MTRRKAILPALMFLIVMTCAMLALLTSMTNARVAERRQATAAFIATMSHLAGTATMNEVATYSAEQALLVTPGTPTPTSWFDAYIKAVDEGLRQFE